MSVMKMLTKAIPILGLKWLHLLKKSDLASIDDYIVVYRLLNKELDDIC